MGVILPLVDAAVHIPARGGLVGLDLGTKTIGVAVSDPDRRLATGVETVARKNFTADARRVLALAAERGSIGFVLGLCISEAVRQKDLSKGLGSAWIAVKALGVGIMIEFSLAMLSTIVFAVGVVVHFVTA